MQSYLRKNYAEESLRLNKECKACSNKHVDNCHRGWHRGIRISWFNQFKAGAELRGLIWNLSLDDLADLYEEQKQRCALTDLDIAFPLVGHPQKALASIDRIDSNVGYTIENIQWVHKDVNLMKQNLSEDILLKLCKQIVEYKKLK
jgi:hypothetical protein